MYKRRNMKSVKYIHSTAYLQQQLKGCQSGRVMGGSRPLPLSLLGVANILA
jgi:hypothetical protein